MKIITDGPTLEIPEDTVIELIPDYGGIQEVPASTLKIGDLILVSAGRHRITKITNEPKPAS